jgi:hypothetical protein
LNIITPAYQDHSIKTLSDFNQSLIQRICEYLGIETVFRNSSEFHLKDDRVDRLISICEQLDATIYLSAPAAKEYITNEFDHIDIGLQWMEYGPYEQNVDSFSDYVSILDTIAALGPGTRKNILL